jgi:hypothetical protein
MELGLHLKRFNDRIKAMNQTNGRDITLSAQDARNIQAEIFDLMTVIAKLSQKQEPVKETVAVESQELDGGSF